MKSLETAERRAGEDRTKYIQLGLAYIMFGERFQPSVQHITKRILTSNLGDDWIRQCIDYLDTSRNGDTDREHE
jgi:hypothetical protein